MIDTAEAPLNAFMFMIHHVLELRGVNEIKEVVFYEDNSGMRAARGLWFLEYYGHPNVKMLDGGFQAWKAAGAPVSTEGTPPKAASFKIAARRDVMATADDVLKALNKNAVVILDTRSRGEYLGTQVRAARGGAIPGAIHVEWTDNLAPDGKFKVQRRAQRHVPTGRHHSGQGSDLLLPGRLPRRAQLRRASPARFSQSAQLSSARGRNGATAAICRSKFPQIKNDAAGLFYFSRLSGFLGQSRCRAAELRKATFSYSAVSMTWFPVKVAVDKGFFRNEGVEPQLIQMNGNVATVALANGYIDFSLNISPVLNGAMQGLGTKLVAALNTRPLFALVVRPEITSAAELKGKTFAVASFGNTQAILTEKHLQHLGLKKGEYQLLALGATPARIAALEKNLVQGSLMPLPTNVQLENRGYRLLGNTAEIVINPIAGLGVQDEKIRKDPDLIKRVLRSDFAQLAAFTVEPTRHGKDSDELDRGDGKGCDSFAGIGQARL